MVIISFLLLCSQGRSGSKRNIGQNVGFEKLSQIGAEGITNRGRFSY